MAFDHLPSRVRVSEEPAADLPAESEPRWLVEGRPRSPRPLQSLVAAASTIAGTKVRVHSTAQRWQAEAWCVDEATEILTADGWVTHGQLAAGTLVYTLDHDSGLAGWEPVEEVARFQVVDEPMLRLSLRHHSSLTTMAHRWPVLRQTYDHRLRAGGASGRAGRVRVWTTSADLAAEDQLVTAAPSRDVPAEAKWSDAFVELVAWFWTEGHIRGDRRRPSVTISQSETVNPDMCARIRRVLTAEFGGALDGSHQGRVAAPAGWREVDGPNGVRYFKLNVAASEALLAVAPGKVVDLGFVRSLTRAQLGLFIDVSVDADGHRNGHPAALLAQRERARIEPLVVACVLAGMSPHLWFSESAQMWRMSLLPRTTVTPRRARSRLVESYTGTVWCPVTRSGSWLARRDGTVWFTGNSMYDTVGELRFVANTLAQAASRARIFAAHLPQGSDDPETVEEENETPVAMQAREAVEVFAGGLLGRSEVVRRLVVQLFVPGDGWLVGLPAGLLEVASPHADEESLPDFGPLGPESLTIDQLKWHCLSVEEVRVQPSGSVLIDIGGGRRELPQDQVMLVRVWRPHPRRWWQADSPVRANLPVLRELVGLTKHVGATIDSRLAGAGLLVVGNSVEVVGQVADGPAGQEEGQDPFIRALIDTMVTPIEDRDSAAAVVPLVIKVPDETVDKVKHITFASPFDAKSRELRDEAIRRLALGLDAPPEVLLGMGGVNHWTGWLVEESTVKTHIEPQLALLCDALTTDYLWPVLEEAGVSAEQAREFVVWFDTTDLTMRPNRAQEAAELYDRGELSGPALRRESGFDDTDAPESVDRATDTALKMMTQMPSLAEAIGIQELIDILREAIARGVAIAKGEEPGEWETDDPLQQGAVFLTAEEKRQQRTETRNRVREERRSARDSSRGTPETRTEVPDDGRP
jgi:hypothetical protein